MSFPLRPQFVGTGFDRWPYISGIGAFLRVTRLNRYTPGDYRFAFGMSVRRQDDLNYLMTFSTKRKEQLAAALDTSEEVHAYWDANIWLPFRCDETVLHHEYVFRFCAECLRHGYHTLLHQLPWIQRCPWHGDGLRSTCLKCRHPLRLDGLGPEWLGACKCGYDHVNERRALRGFTSVDDIERACSIYLEWARVQQSQSRLVAPSPNTRSLSILANAFALPPTLAWRVDDPGNAPTNIHRVVARPEAAGRQATEDICAALTKLESLDDTRAAMIEATGRLTVRIASAACRLARELPPASLSDTEMTLFLEPAGAKADQTFVPARRRSILEIRSLPLTIVGSRSYLDLHCVTQVTRQVGYQVMHLCWPGWPPNAASLSRESLADLQVCLSAVQETIARGYAEGIRVAMGHHLPDLYRAGRNRPHLSEPWVLLRKEPDSRLVIEIIWARLPHNPD